jgi:Tfp pilus assembly protein PilF
LKGRYYHDQKFWGVTFKEEDFREAKTMFEKAIELDPNYALAYAGLADLYDTYLTNIDWNPEYDDLRRSLIEKAYSLDPNLPYVLEVKSYVLEREGKLDEAYASLQKALEISPNESEYNLVMGIFLRGEGLILQAIRYFTIALQQNPLDNMIYIYRGNAYMVIGDYAAAEADIKKALQIEPQHVVGLNLLAQLSIMKKDYDAAEAYLSQCETINPNYRDYNITKAWLFAAKGDKEKALAAHEDDIVYLLLGLNNEAFKQLNILIEKDWSGTQALYRHDSYLALKNMPFYDGIRNDPRFMEILEKEKKKYETELQKYGVGK